MLDLLGLLMDTYRNGQVSQDRSGGSWEPGSYRNERWCDTSRHEIRALLNLKHSLPCIMRGTSLHDCPRLNIFDATSHLIWKCWHAGVLFVQNGKTLATYLSLFCQLKHSSTLWNTQYVSIVTKQPSQFWLLQSEQSCYPSELRLAKSYWAFISSVLG